MNTAKSKTNRVYSRSHEPIVWSLFGAGGMVVAFLMPALVLITGFVVPLEIAEPPTLTYTQVLQFCRSWLGAPFILACIALPAFHAAHRLYHGLHDLHLHGPDWLMLSIFYGGASGLTCATVVFLCMVGVGGVGEY